MIKSIKSGGGGAVHESGEAIAFWFGTGEHENLDRLPELLKPLNLGNVYTDEAMRITGVFTGGSGCYEEKHAKDRKETTVTGDMECPVSEKRA